MGGLSLRRRPGAVNACFNASLTSPLVTLTSQASTLGLASTRLLDDAGDVHNISVAGLVVTSYVADVTLVLLVSCATPATLPLLLTGCETDDRIGTRLGSSGGSAALTCAEAGCRKACGAYGVRPAVNGDICCASAS